MTSSKKQREIAAQQGKDEPEIKKIYTRLVDGLKERIVNSPSQTCFLFLSLLLNLIWLLSLII